MQIKRLGHVNLSVDDVAAAEAFYGGLLGLQRAARPADAARAGVWFRLGELELHISIEADAQNAKSMRHVAFEVDDLAEWRATFEARGMAIDEGRPAPGMQRFFIRDPAGNRLEFYQLN